MKKEENKKRHLKKKSIWFHSFYTENDISTQCNCSYDDLKLQTPVLNETVHIMSRKYKLVPVLNETVHMTKRKYKMI